MAMPAHSPRIKPAHVAGAVIALLVIAAPSAAARQLMMLGLFVVMWLSMIVIDHIARQKGRPSGLRPYILAVGLGLVVLVSIALFGTR